MSEPTNPATDEEIELLENHLGPDLFVGEAQIRPMLARLQEAEKLRDALRQNFLEEFAKNIDLEEKLRVTEAKVEQLISDQHKISEDYTDAMKRLRALEEGAREYLRQADRIFNEDAKDPNPYITARKRLTEALASPIAARGEAGPAQPRDPPAE